MEIKTLTKPKALELANECSEYISKLRNFSKKEEEISKKEIIELINSEDIKIKGFDKKAIIIYGYKDKKPYIFLLYVVPEERKKGLAKKLIDFALNDLSKNTLYLSVDNNNPAINFYKKIGFIKIDKNKLSTELKLTKFKYFNY